ncbi:MAG: hypothetical protein V3W14_11755, partial [Candidatus Neomarinimicrobiota bacterium]
MVSPKGDLLNDFITRLAARAQGRIMRVRPAAINSYSTGYSHTEGESWKPVPNLAPFPPEGTTRTDPPEDAPPVTQGPDVQMPKPVAGDQTYDRTQSGTQHQLSADTGQIPGEHPGNEETTSKDVGSQEPHALSIRSSADPGGIEPPVQAVPVLVDSTAGAIPPT